MSISPFEVLPPPPELPQAKANSVATMRTPSPLARTIWFPLVIPGRPVAFKADGLPSLAALFPTVGGQHGRGESAPASSAATRGGRTATPMETIDPRRPASQVTTGDECNTLSIGERSAVINDAGGRPGGG